jgi:hypothetical protein
MALYYQTEYRMGRRGRICRSYTGLQALAAIGIDLFFGLIFEFLLLLPGLIARVVVIMFRFAVELLRRVWKILVEGMTVLVYLLTLPFALLHLGADWLWSQLTAGRPNRRRSRADKPDWSLGREV